MKRVTVVIRQREISKFFPQAFQLTLKNEASIIDAIKAVDEEIRRKLGVFPVEKYESLLQMVYHPVENRFYKQVAIHANVKTKPINIRENITAPLPDETNGNFDTGKWMSNRLGRTNLALFKGGFYF